MKWNHLRVCVVAVVGIGCALCIIGDIVWIEPVLIITTFLSAFIDDTERESSEQGFHLAA